MAFSLPDGSPVTEKGDKLNYSWLQWFSQVNNVINAVIQSGTTAQRPTRFVWLGRRYFDTTLGKPIYVRSVNPIVWVDADGNVDGIPPVEPVVIDHSFTYDPPSLPTGTGSTTTVAVTGAMLGDFVQVAAPYSLQGLQATAYVPAADQVAVRVQNGVGFSVDLASGTWKVRLTR